jgi:RNA polymerase sigma-70 factor (ECF subfamily)
LEVKRASRSAQVRIVVSGLPGRGHPEPGGPGRGPVPLELLLGAVARGDQEAFTAMYDRVASTVFGVVKRVVRDQAQSEEVTQEVFVEVWRTASRFDATLGDALPWIAGMAHRRAIDRVRSAQRAADRDQRAARRETTLPYDEVAEVVETRLEHEQVRRGLAALTDLQREAVTLAYYGGYTQREVAALTGTPLGTVKTRMLAGMRRLEQELGAVPEATGGALGTGLAPEPRR